MSSTLETIAKKVWTPNLSVGCVNLLKKIMECPLLDDEKMASFKECSAEKTHAKLLALLAASLLATRKNQVIGIFSSSFESVQYSALKYWGDICEAIKFDARTKCDLGPSAGSISVTDNKDVGTTTVEFFGKKPGYGFKGDLIVVDFRNQDKSWTIIEEVIAPMLVVKDASFFGFGWAEETNYEYIEQYSLPCK